jgi:hypothetical protein
MPGSPFTGSTLLGTLLNEHPDCTSIGAATGLIRTVELSSYRCSCGRRFQECEFWSYVAERTRTLGYPVTVFKTDFWNTHLRLSKSRLGNALLVRSLKADALNTARDGLIARLPRVQAAVSKMQWSTWSLAAAVLEKTGKSVFVDTARDHQRPKYLAKHPLLDVRVIHLIRDPRGNTASIMKHTGADVKKAARAWRHYNIEADRVSRYLPEASWMTLRYEDLCRDPAGVLDQISLFLEVERSKTIGQRLPDVEHHIIGNSMRLSNLAAIREDLSWQTRLTDTDLAVIARLVGSTSHRFGYQWP